MTANLSKIKQDLMNTLTQNLNKDNIYNLIEETNNSLKLKIRIEINKKGYNCYEALIISVREASQAGQSEEVEVNETSENSEKKLNGFGRSEFEALRQAVFNIFDSLLNNENTFYKVREVLKVLSENIFENNFSNAINNPSKQAKVSSSLVLPQGKIESSTVLSGFNQLRTSMDQLNISNKPNSGDSQSKLERIKGQSQGQGLGKNEKQLKVSGNSQAQQSPIVTKQTQQREIIIKPLRAARETNLRASVTETVSANVFLNNCFEENKNEDKSKVTHSESFENRRRHGSEKNSSLKTGANINSNESIPKDILTTTKCFNNRANTHNSPEANPTIIPNSAIITNIYRKDKGVLGSKPTQAISPNTLSSKETPTNATKVTSGEGNVFANNSRKVSPPDSNSECKKCIKSQECLECPSLKKKLEEKNLIILELEKMVLDFMAYNKKIVNIFESESLAEKYPDYFKCPITWEKIVDPVIMTEDGQTYERSAIEKWLKSQHTSPVTGLPLADTNLMINNYLYKSALDDFLRKQKTAKRMKTDLQKYITKSEYDLNDLKKYFD